VGRQEHPPKQSKLKVVLEGFSFIDSAEKPTRPQMVAPSRCSRAAAAPEAPAAGTRQRPPEEDDVVLTSHRHGQRSTIFVTLMAKLKSFLLTTSSAWAAVDQVKVAAGYIAQFLSRKASPFPSPAPINGDWKRLSAGQGARRTISTQ
jgi:hypothetical protein